MTKQEIVQLIMKTATEEGVEASLCVAVAECEGGLNPNAVNKNNDAKHTIDRGLYQFNDFWYKNIPNDEAFDVIKSTRAFCNVVKAGRLIDWKYSMPCWSKKVASEVIAKYIKNYA